MIAVDAIAERAEAAVEPLPGSEKVQLICPPFQALTLSSLSVALLGSVLRRQGIPLEESYLHFDFARQIGLETYARIAAGGPEDGLVGELLFAEGLHGEVDGEIRDRLDALFGPPPRRRELLAAYSASCLDRVAEARPTLVGLTTSNYQLIASLWLTREIKRRWPRIRVVLGGAACNVPMGRRIREGYPEVDVVVSGAGEEPLLRLARGEEGGEGGLIVNEISPDLDSLPVPDYEPFLREARAFDDDRRRLMLAFESSRGCWWGEKSHCAFCGLNQLEMAFHQKSSARVVQEVRSLWDRYGFPLFATDTILSRAHLKEVMPALAAYPSRPKVFYEVKANMKSAEVRALRAANVVWIQPGVESLSSALLSRIGKGISALQNLALLKWCREEGIVVSWNLLCGIPGERTADYETQIELIGRIPHLSPPQGVSPVRIDRYSPYFRDFKRFGWSGIQPFDEYRFLHPHLGEEAIRDLAYHFHAQGGWPLDTYLPRLSESVERWKRRHSRGEGLFFNERDGLVRIEDGEAFVIGPGPVVAAVVRNSHDIVGLEEFCRAAGCESGLVEDLAARGVLYREGDRLVNLAVRLREA